MMHGEEEGGTEGVTDGLMHEQIFGEPGFALRKEWEQNKEKRTGTSCPLGSDDMLTYILNWGLFWEHIFFVICHPLFIHRLMPSWALVDASLIHSALLS